MLKTVVKVVEEIFLVEEEQSALVTPLDSSTTLRLEHT